MKLKVTQPLLAMKEGGDMPFKARVLAFPLLGATLVHEVAILHLVMDLRKDVMNV